MKNHERTSSVLEDLRALGEPDARDERFRAELAAVLLAQTSAETEPLRTIPRYMPRTRKPRVGLAVAVAAGVTSLALVASLVVAGHRGASAEALLRRVAAVTFPPNQARHLIYDVRMTLSGRVAAGTGEIWIATNASGQPVQASETLRLAKFPSAPTRVVERDIQTPLGTYTYDGTHNAIVVPSRNDPGWSAHETSTLPLPVYLFDGKTVARRLAELYSHGAARVRLLSRRALEGVVVDPIQVDGWPHGAAVTTTLYFDAASHLLRGFDSRGTDPRYNSPVWRVRLVQQTSTPRHAAPAGAFRLNAPSSAVVTPPPPAMAALMRLCRAQLKPLLTSGQNLFDACRVGNPAITKTMLIDALTGSARQDLARAVAAHAISERQAAAALQGQRAQIIKMLDTGRPVVKLSVTSGK